MLLPYFITNQLTDPQARGVAEMAGQGAKVESDLMIMDRITELGSEMLNSP